MKSLNQKLLHENIDRVAQYDMANHKIFGFAYLVYHDGFTFEQCYGSHFGIDPVNKIFAVFMKKFQS